MNKTSWQTKKLGDFCEVITKGTTPTSIGYKFLDKGINFIKIESITLNGNFLFNKLAHISQECHESLKRSELKENDILFSIAGALGRAAVVSKNIIPANINQALAIIRLKSSNDFTRKFILLALNSGLILEQIKKAKGGVAQQNLSLTQLNNFEISLPPLSEQHRIVKILDEVFEKLEKAKENTEKNLQNSRDLFESYLQNVFANPNDDWEEKKLGDVTSLITDGKHGDCRDQDNSGYYFLSAKDIKNNTLNYENARQIRKDDFDETHRRTDLKPGDVLVTNSGTIGRMAIAPSVNETCKTTFQKSVAVIKPILSILNNNFCMYALKADLSKLVKVSAGTAQKNLLLGDLRSHLILIPSLIEQKSIVKKLDELSEQTKKLEEIYKQKLADLEELKKSILQSAFTPNSGFGETKKAFAGELVN